MKLVVLVLALLVSTANADQWVTPTARTVTSPNQKLQALVTPAKDGKSGATVTIGAKNQPGKTFTLATPWMPVDTVLFDDGSFLTFDNWHSLGYGKVATMYEPNGSTRWTKTLVDLVGQAFADSVVHSVSSIWWRKQPLEWTIAKDGKSGLVTLIDENQIRIELRTGTTGHVAVPDLPDDPRRLFNRARVLAGQPGYEANAIALLERAIAKDPDMFEAILLYVQTLQRMNEHARADTGVEKMSKAWKTKDGYNIANVYVAWATSLTALSRKPDAERVLRLAVVAAPTYPNPALALATMLVDGGKPKDADVVLGEFVDRLLKASDLDTYGLSSIAAFYKQRKQFPKALALYLKGYKKDQVTNQFLYLELAKVYEEMGKDADAIRINEQLLAYFKKMGSAFDIYTKQVTDELTRLRAKKRP